MYWNYRVVNIAEDNAEEPFYEVCEVFYDESDVPAGWAKASVCGEDMKVLRECMEKMVQAMELPTLHPVDFTGSLYNPEDLH